MGVRMGEKKNFEKELEKTTKELDDTKSRLDEYTDTLKRLQAEFENYMKRVEKERTEMQSCASEGVVRKLLIVMDDFDNALKQMKEGEDKEGMKMIAKNIKKLLDDEGIRPIECIGKNFDPYKHEVVQRVEGDEGRIIEEVQKGYMLKDKVIRTSKVKIGGK